MTENTQLDSSVTQTQDTVSSVTQTPEAAAQPIAQDKKPLKMALVGMGIVAVLGAGYF